MSAQEHTTSKKDALGFPWGRAKPTVTPPPAPLTPLTISEPFKFEAGESETAESPPWIRKRNEGVRGRNMPLLLPRPKSHSKVAPTKSRWSSPTPQTPQRTLQSQFSPTLSEGESAIMLPTSPATQKSYATAQTRTNTMVSEDAEIKEEFAASASPVDSSAGQSCHRSVRELRRREQVFDGEDRNVLKHRHLSLQKLTSSTMGSLAKADNVLVMSHRALRRYFEGEGGRGRVL